MAVEAKRKCGYRKIGGTYIVADPGMWMPCCKLPIPLKICPCCGAGIKQARGWTWIDPQPWIGQPCSAPDLQASWCPASNPARLGAKVGLLWIGEEFYPTVEEFAAESNAQGISRRIAAVPRGFKVGEHWVFLAHPHVIEEPAEDLTGGTIKTPAIFRIFKPSRIERIVTDEMAKDETEMERLRLQGITPVIVPADDKDHQGTVWDKEDDDEDKLI
jgi:hypothetical protein